MTRTHLPYADGRALAGLAGMGAARIGLMVLAGLIGAGAGIALDSVFNLFAE
ncbi:MAG: hypothetical protein R3C13_01745 [Hyphomonas sp.]|uniref:hypothetical protein n=1 Tax=Hyphomonas sp. TaxID=87 RepID=UPI0035279A50